jgi:ubiquinone/menaquinone biosynthesis C-methylase UbiE
LPDPAGVAKRRVRAEYDALAPHYEGRWSGYIAASAEETLKRAHPIQDERVLDLGCGTGVLLQRILDRYPGAQVTGVDLSLVMVALARRRLPESVRLEVADAEALPFASSSFDLVVSTSSFHFWPAPKQALAELRRVLRPGGRLVITDWCDEYLACRICDRLLRLINRAHQRIYGRSECAALLAGADFRVTSLERYRISWLWGLMTAIANVPQGLQANLSVPPQPERSEGSASDMS